MKLKKLFLATLSLFAFAACTDTPDSPYDFPNGGGNSGTTEEGVYISETFASDFGVFTPVETVGNYPWVIDYSTAKATSFVDGANNAATSWLISPAVDFTEETEAYVAFDYIIRYAESGKVAKNHQLLISSDYTGDPAAATWTDLPYGAVEGADWNTFYKANVAVPAEFLGKSGIVFALRYTATTKAGTWEVKNFKVAHGTAAAPEEPEEAQEYTVSEAIAAFTGVAKPAIVKGYIVGFINGMSITDGATFGNNPPAEANTNLLIADNIDETDVANCMPVQLPSGAVRNALNLVDNPGNYKKQVTLTGSLEKYFGVPGLKYVSKFEIEGATPEEPETPEGAYISETFATDFGSFTTQQTVGNYPWVIDYSTAKATSYVDGTNNAATSWLISSPVDFTEETEAYVAFEYIIQYALNNTIAENHKLLVCADYAGDAATATWTNIPYGATPGSKTADGKADWNTFYKANVAVPAEFLGKNAVTFALCYTGTEEKAATWEVRNFVVAHGAATGETPEEPETPDTPDVPTGDNLLINGSFEEWNGGDPTAWGTGNIGHNATIAQSTNAYDGNYSVLVNGYTTNKRLGSQKYTLSAGTYTLAAYIKHEGADAAAFKLGYGVIKNGAIANADYKYPATETYTTAEWTLYSYEFTLAEEAEVAILVMNNKKGNGNSFLVDNVTLTTADGNVSGGDDNGDNNEEPETPADTYTFTAVTSITPGAEYLIVAGTNQATALDASKSYGYLPVTTVSPANGVVNTTADNVFVIEAVDGGYSIKDAQGRYLYMTGTFNNVNLDTTLPAEGGVWTIEFNADGTAKIANTFSGKFMQYSSQYNSYGVYSDARGEMPTLYKKN